MSSDHDLQIVDLTVVSTDEEKELDFLRTVGAIAVTNIDWGKNGTTTDLGVERPQSPPWHR